MSTNVLEETISTTPGSKVRLPLKRLTRFQLGSPFWLLLAITSGAFVLRFYNLQRNSLWYDEAYDLAIAYDNSFLDTIFYYRPWDTHPPFFFPVVHLWMRLFGETELPVRMFALVVGVTTLVPLYALARHWFKAEVALTGTLLLAVSSLHLGWSQSDRPYGWMTLLTLISMGLLWLAIEQPRQSWRWLTYGLSASVLFYTHYLGIHIIFCQAVVLAIVLFGNWGALVRAGITLVMVGVSFLPYLGNFLRHSQNGDPTAYAAHSLSQFLDTFELFSSWYLPSSFGLVAWLVFLPLYLAGAGWLWFNRRKLAIFLICWSFLPILTTWISSVLVRPNFVPRYMSFCLPAFLLTIAVGIWSLRSKQFRFAVYPYIALGLVVGLSLMACLNYYQTYKQADWRGMVNYIVENKQPEDVVLLANPYGYTGSTFDYYYVHNMSSSGNLARLFIPQEPGVPEKMAQLFNKPRRVWLVSFYDGNAKWINDNIIPNIPKNFKWEYYQEIEHGKQPKLTLALLVKQD